MTTAMPVLVAERLLIRPFMLGDLDDVHRILDLEYSFTGGSTDPWTRQERQSWLTWSIANHDQLGKVYQPPYGDKAIVLRSSGHLIGVCGFVPCLGPFEQIPALLSHGMGQAPGSRAEVGLFYILSREHRHRGFATEAGQALIKYAFEVLELQRIIATTTHDNVESIAVMRRLGMTVDRNPYPLPSWLQVVGVLQNPIHRQADVKRMRPSE